MKKKNFFSFFFIFFSNKSVLAENNIYFIDIQFIFSNSEIGKKINNQLNSKSKDIKKEFSNYQNLIKEEKIKLEGQKKILSENDFNNKKSELEVKIKNYNGIISKKEKAFVKTKNETYNIFLKELLGIVNEYAQKNSIQLILKKENIILGKNNLDISNDILSLLNKKIKDIKLK